MIKNKKFKVTTDMILVTEKNRKMAVVIGRIIYRVKKSGEYSIAVVRPRIVKGKWTIEGDPYLGNKFTFQTSKDEPEEEWERMHKEIFKKIVEDKNGYIKPNEPLVKYKINKLK